MIFNRFQTEEFVAGHCQACACRQEDGDDIDQRILRGIGQSCRYSGYFEKITETQTSHQRRYRRQKQGYDDGYDNREYHLFKVTYRTKVDHLDLSLFLGRAHFHDWRLDERNQGHVAVCRYGDSTQEIGSQLGCQVNGCRAVSTADDADSGSLLYIEAKHHSACQCDKYADLGGRAEKHGLRVS